MLNENAEVLVPPHKFAHYDEVSRSLNLETELIIKYV